MATHPSMLAWSKECGGLVHGVTKSWSRLSGSHFFPDPLKPLLQPGPISRKSQKIKSSFNSSCLV